MRSKQDKILSRFSKPNTSLEGRKKRLFSASFLSIMPLQLTSTLQSIVSTKGRHQRWFWTFLFSCFLHRTLRPRKYRLDEQECDLPKTPIWLIDISKKTFWLVNPIPEPSNWLTLIEILSWEYSAYSSTISAAFYFSFWTFFSVENAKQRKT